MSFIHMASTITQFFSIQSGSSTWRLRDSDNIVLASVLVNPNHDPAALIEPDEFKLQGMQYIHCCTLAKGSKNTKKWISIIWIYGEDIQAKHNGKKFWYYYFYEKQGNQQELSVVGKGNCTALDHLKDKHSIDRSTGNIKPVLKPLKKLTQLSISDYNNMKLLIFAYCLDYFKDMLVR